MIVLSLPISETVGEVCFSLVKLCPPGSGHLSSLSVAVYDDVFGGLSVVDLSQFGSALSAYGTSQFGSILTVAGWTALGSSLSVCGNIEAYSCMSVESPLVLVEACRYSAIVNREDQRPLLVL